MMQPHIWMWAWTIVAIVMLVAEILSPGMYALPFAVGSATAAGLEYAQPGSIDWQWTAFFAVSCAVFVVGQWIIRRRKPAVHQP